MKTANHNSSEPLRPKSIRNAKKSRGWNGKQFRLTAESLEQRNLMATFAVNAIGDGVFGDLRSAVNAANLTAGPDTIVFNVDNVHLNIGQIHIAESVHIDGSSAPSGHVNISTTSGDRLFLIDDASPLNQVVEIDHVTLTGGVAPDGGAILNGEDLEIQDSTISGNTAVLGGGIANFGRVGLERVNVENNTGRYYGGGLFNSSVVEIVDSNVVGNSVFNYGGVDTFGGGIHNELGAVTILDRSSVFANNALAGGAARAHGGGISTRLGGLVHSIDSQVFENYSDDFGGGVFANEGGIALFELNSQVFSNQAGEFGGGMYLSEGAFGDIVDTTISDNLAELGGGGISAGRDVQLNLVNTIVRANSTDVLMPDGSGGGLYLSGFGTGNGPQVTVQSSLIVRNNYSAGGTPSGEFGGGISVRYGATVDIADTEISQNAASISGGGIYASDRFTPYAPQLTLSHSQVFDNEATSLGGGMTMAGGTLDIRYTDFANNSTDGRGGGLLLTGFGSPSALQTEIRGSVISGNFANLEGGGLAAGPNMTLNVDNTDVLFNRTYGKGGGMYLTELGVGVAPHVTSISDSYLLENVAVYDPAAPPYAPSEASGGGVWAGAGAEVTITQSTVTGNVADRVGGGMVAKEAPVWLIDSTFSFNHAGRHGGGSYFYNSDVQAFQNTFYGNGAGYNGGGIYATAFLPNHITLEHNTITLNQADSTLNGSSGGGLFVKHDPANILTLDVANTIIADNFSGLPFGPHIDDVFDPGQHMAATYSLIGSSLGSGFSPANPDAHGNRIGSPVSPIDPMLGPLTNNGGATLTRLPQSGSPAIDEGDPTLLGPGGADQRGKTRISGGRIDIGSVEVQVQGDFDSDGDWDCDDINALTQEIAAGNFNAVYDLNQDGIVDLTDVDVWLCIAGNVNLGPNLSYRPGDANLDGFVDGQDFIVWNSNKFQANAFWCAADFNADGFIDGQDFIIWNANKFQGSIPCVPPIVLNPTPYVDQVDDSGLTHDSMPDGTALPTPGGQPSPSLSPAVVSGAPVHHRNRSSDFETDGEPQVAALDAAFAEEAQDWILPA